MTEIPPGCEIPGPSACSTQRSLGGCPDEGEQERARSHFETAFVSSASHCTSCQTPAGAARFLQSHWTLRLKGEVREGHVEINFLTICPFPVKRLR